MQPKVYTLEEHQIHPHLIDEEALSVITALQKAGFTSYLVGGSIRDLLLGHRPKDFDISTSAQPEEIKKLFKYRCILVGRRFRLAHIRFKNKIIEVSTFRSGNIEDDDLITQDNTWGTPEEDVLRRDFKINGLFYDPSTHTLIDYVGGFEDTQQRRLQAIGEPFVRFRQDPVRMIRLVKFQARFDLNIDEKTHLDFLECRSEILKSSQARILEEIMRMLHSGSSSKFIRLMTNYGLLEQLLPEVSSFIEFDDQKLIYRYLSEIDSMIQNHSNVHIERSILVSALLFPIIDHQLKQLSEDRSTTPHLGMIQMIVKSHIDASFSAFFQLSKKIKSEILFLITSQYRLTPFKDSHKKLFKIPPSIYFRLAMKFFNLRCRIDPQYLPLWDAWKTAYDKVKQNKLYFKPFRPKRRRRK